MDGINLADNDGAGGNDVSYAYLVLHYYICKLTSNCIIIQTYCYRAGMAVVHVNLPMKYMRGRRVQEWKGRHR